MNLIEMNNIKKYYGNFKAVDIDHLSVPKGSIVGFLGPNGAGKTSTIRMLMQITKPDQGAILFDGNPVNLSFLDRVGYLPEERGLYQKLKVGEMIDFFAQLKGLSHTKIKQRASFFLKKFELDGYHQKKVQELSKGMQQKLQFITTIIHEPDLIILDEPFSGLDPVNAEVLQQTIFEEAQRGATVIFSTHIMNKAEQICKTIIMIDHGLPVLNDTMAKIRTDFSQGLYLLEFAGDDSFLKQMPEIIYYQQEKPLEYILKLKTPQDSQILLRKAMDAGTVEKFTKYEPSLEEIFIRIVKEGKHHEN